MPRELNILLTDILESIRKLSNYTEELSLEEFKKKELIQDGVARNLEVIGEAIKRIPDNIRVEYPQIEWKKLAGLRDILIHQYFSIDFEIIWDVVKNKIPELKMVIENLIAEHDE